jgi:phage gpG-like protein
MGVNIRLKNKVDVNKLNRKLRLMGPSIEKAAGDLLTEWATSVHGEAVKLLNNKKGSKTETRYTGTGGKRSVLVSDPGSPPNTDTGHLVQNTTFNVDRPNLDAQVGTNVKYGAWLEFGTINIEARPWLSRAARKFKKMIRGLSRAMISSEIAKVNRRV